MGDARKAEAPEWAEVSPFAEAEAGLEEAVETEVPAAVVAPAPATALTGQAAQQVEKAAFDSAQAEFYANIAALQKAIDEATSVRKREKAAFDSALAESRAFVAAFGRFGDALNEGAAGSFLRSGTAKTLHKLVARMVNFDAAEREFLLAFLSGDAQRLAQVPAPGRSVFDILEAWSGQLVQDHVAAIAMEKAAVKAYKEATAAKIAVLPGDARHGPASGQLVGILKERGLQMMNDREAAIATEEAAVKASEKELATLKWAAAEVVRLRARAIARALRRARRFGAFP